MRGISTTRWRGKRAEYAILAAMNLRMALGPAALLAALQVLPCIPALADDSAASVAAGGLVARRETRIVMANEVLKISPQKVVVDYDFRNDTDESVTTEVAFPIPPYENSPDQYPPKVLSFSDFKLAINGTPVRVATDARAFLKGHEVTDALKASNIDIASFGHWDADNETPEDFARLSKADQGRLVRLGLFSSDEPWGNWTVHLQYHWTQVFPPHSTVHIRHEYSPAGGSELMPRVAIEKALGVKKQPGQSSSTPEDSALLTSFCPDSGILHAVENSMLSAGASFAQPYWVDFILKSANTWRRPIEDFTLVVERGTPDESGDTTLVSFCSPQNAPVKNVDADQFSVHLSNFIPKADLHIGFFDLPAPKNGEVGKRAGASTGH